MAYDDKAKERTMKYMKESRDKLTMNLPKGDKERYKAYAESKGMSLTQLFVSLIEKEMGTMNRTQWSKAVKKRDGQLCRYCGASERLEAHHMIPASERPELLYDVRNGITLCHKHHRIAHHGDYNGQGRSGILLNREWFTEEVLADMDNFICRAIEAQMERDNESL